MGNYTPEQIERRANHFEKAGILDIAAMLRDYATLRQQAGRVDASDLDVLRRLRDALPTVGLNGWMAGVGALDAAITALAQNTQGEAVADKRTTGVYHKFNVTRTDGSDQPGGKHHGCEYFVLDLTHDPFAKPAAAAYADACESEYPVLAADMRNRYGLHAERARVPAVDGVRFVAWMIDNREGCYVTEEGLQGWLAEYLREEAAAPSQRAEVDSCGFCGKSGKHGFDDGCLNDSAAFTLTGASK